jgi:hypothetical protein
MKGPPSCVRQADTIKCRKADRLPQGKRVYDDFSNGYLSNGYLSNDDGVDVPGSQHGNDSKQ